MLHQDYEVCYDNAGRYVKKIRISPKFRKIAEVYASFSRIRRVDNAPKRWIELWDEYDSYRDFSEGALEEFFRKESYGEGFPITLRRENGKINGYIEGQKWFNLTKTKYWIPDIKSGELIIKDLYQSDIPDWFLNKVLKNMHN